jgi:hypothetical protein
MSVQVLSRHSPSRAEVISDESLPARGPRVALFWVGPRLSASHLSQDTAREPNIASNHNSPHSHHFSAAFKSNPIPKSSFPNICRNSERGPFVFKKIPSTWPGQSWLRIRSTRNSPFYRQYVWLLAGGIPLLRYLNRIK